MAEIAQEIAEAWEGSVESTRVLGDHPDAELLRTQSMDKETRDELSARQLRAALAVFEELDREPLSDEELKILDEFEEFRRQQPFSLGRSASAR